jgi:hypothetical protein
LGEPLKRANKLLSRLKATELLSFPFRGKVGMGAVVTLHSSAPPPKPIPTLTLPLKGRETTTVFTKFA